MKHQQASKSTKLFLSTVSLAFLVVAGCSTPDEITVGGESASDIETLEEVQFDLAFDGVDYKLLNGDASIKVGYSETAALRAFEQPTKSFGVRSLPNGFGAEFSAGGWEKGDDAFACIFYKKALVLGMYIKENVDDEDIQAELALYQGKYGTPTMSFDETKRVRYYFWYGSDKWSSSDRMLMINTAVDINDVRSMTVAIGVPEIMSHIGMDPKQARTDLDAAQQSLTAQKAEE